MKNKSIPIYQPFIGEKEKENVLQCIEDNWISSKGEFINRFENEFCSFTGSKYASSVTNGTVALHLALLALDVGPGDEVIVPVLTYIASINAIKYVGAKPVFIDSKIDTWNIDENKIEREITSKTKAIMAVHLYGNSCNMNSISRICKKHELFLIEDAAESFGTYYNGLHAGTIGDIGTFSFFGNKTITTGEGGMVVTKNNNLIKKINVLKNQGLSNKKEYFHDIIGYNYRMTNICAAIGLGQLSKAKKILKLKKTIFGEYKRLLENEDVVFPLDEENSINSYWMVSLLFRNQNVCNHVRKKLEVNKIETRPIFPLINSMPMYKNNEHFSVALDISNRGINLPSFPSLSYKNLKFIADEIISYLR